MTTEIVPINMDYEEARERTDSIRNSVSLIRLNLLHIFTRQGWRSLGYNSWHIYLVEEFPDTHQSYLRRQTKSALLEAKLADGDEMVGTTKESHLRPLTETLPDDSQRVLAYHLTLSRVSNPKAKDFQTSAWEVSVMYSSFTTLKDRLSAGEISTSAAYHIAKQIEDKPDEIVFIGERVSDPDIVPIISRLYKQKSDTWQEILLSQTIPAFPDPLPIGQATATQLTSWLNLASAEHKAVAIAEKNMNGILCEEIVVAVSDMLKSIYTVGIVCDDTVTQKISRLANLIEVYHESS